MSEYRECTRCIMDTTATGITFDAEGRCNFCADFLRRLASYQPASAGERKGRLDALVARIQADGHGKAYDCVVGLSGGADSAYTLYLAKECGLRPLAVHMDNGWNTELAVNNIENLVRKLEVDLFTHVIKWQEYRKLMLAFLDADVLDVELLYDNAMLAVNYGVAAKHDIKWILAGTNVTTEGMRMPATWNWFKYDKKNIEALAKRGGAEIDTFPTMSTLSYIRQRYVQGTNWVSFLDFVEYSKPRAAEILVEKVGYRTYPFKHYESIFTRFYQGYILPQKFGIDKRRLHLSTLIVSGQMERHEALKLMTPIAYPSDAALKEDIDYFLKKVGWRRAQLTDYLRRPEVSHARYGTERALWEWAERLGRHLGLVRPVELPAQLDLEAGAGMPHGALPRSVKSA